MDRLSDLNATLIRDLGAGIEGPVAFRRPMFSPFASEDEQALIRANAVIARQLEAERSAKEEAIAKAQAEAAAARAATEVALGAERERAVNTAAQLERELAADRALLAERDASLARLREDLAAEEESAAMRVAQAETVAKAERERTAIALAAEERAREQIVALEKRQSVARPAPAPKPRQLKMEPNFDRAGLLRGFTLKNGLQTVEVKIARDGAGVPLELELNPI
jgi:hypothetical protein